MNFLGTAPSAAADAVTKDYVDKYRMFAYKSSDQASATNNTALADDNHITFTLEASTYYAIDSFIVYVGNSSGDLKFNFTKPSGATLNLSAFSITTAATVLTAQNVNFTVYDGSSDITAGCVTSTNAQLLLTGTVYGGSGGAFTLRFGQNSSNGTATSLLTGSWMRLAKLS